MLREVTEIRLVQPLKEAIPMDLTLLGIIMDFKLLQLSKVRFFIEVILFGIVTDTRL